MNEREVRAALDAARTARTTAIAVHATALDEIRALVPLARAVGISMTEIAELVGVARPTLYQMLEKRQNDF